MTTVIATATDELNVGDVAVVRAVFDPEPVSAVLHWRTQAGVADVVTMTPETDPEVAGTWIGEVPITTHGRWDFKVVAANPPGVATVYVEVPRDAFA